MKHLAPDELEVTLEFGEIDGIKGDTLLATINSWGPWTNGVNAALLESAETHFHDQIPSSGLRHLDAFQSLGDPSLNLSFNDVVFVVDDEKSGLADVVLTGLKFADEQLAKTVILPMVTFCPDRNMTGPRAFELLSQIRPALAAFQGSGPFNVRCIRVVFPKVLEGATSGSTNGTSPNA